MGEAKQWGQSLTIHKHRSSLETVLKDCTVWTRKLTNLACKHIVVSLPVDTVNCMFLSQTKLLTSFIVVFKFYNVPYDVGIKFNQCLHLLFVVTVHSFVAVVLLVVFH